MSTASRTGSAEPVDTIAACSYAVSVVICTHNPRRAYLSRVMAALQQQTLPRTEWELVVVDNRSAPPLDEWVDVSWHGSGRIVREPCLGLTRARLRGIDAARGQLLVFVDDDNVLDERYLEEAVALFHANDRLAVASGTAEPVYEVLPPPWLTDSHRAMLALRTVNKESFIEGEYSFQSAPIGAGMVVRAGFASGYVDSVKDSDTRLALDRTGGSLASGGDTDMVMSALEHGFVVGLSPKLRLAHLISRERTTLEYLVRLQEGIAFSNVVVYAIRGIPYGQWIKKKNWKYHIGALFRPRTAPAPIDPILDSMRKAERRGTVKGLAYVRALGVAPQVHGKCRPITAEHRP